MTKWLPIETLPDSLKEKSVLLVVAGTRLPIYCGRKRFGNLGEPSQGKFAWRCDSSGRFSNPTHYMLLPDFPEVKSS